MKAFFFQITEWNQKAFMLYEVKQIPKDKYVFALM